MILCAPVAKYVYQWLSLREVVGVGDLARDNIVFKDFPITVYIHISPHSTWPA